MEGFGKIAWVAGVEGNCEKEQWTGSVVVGLARCLCAAAVKMPVGTLYVPQCPGGGGGGVCCILLATSDLRV